MKAFKLSTDPLFVEKIYDVVGLYLDPPESAQSEHRSLNTASLATTGQALVAEPLLVSGRT